MGLRSSEVCNAWSRFYTDAYDLFIIGIAKPMMAIVYYPQLNGKLAVSDDLWVTGVALVGALIGQLTFGFLGDYLGRKKVYLVTLIIMICGTIGQCFAASTVKGIGFVTELCIWRFVLGVGIGGDYPLSATIATEYSPTKWRGAFVASVFAMQGLGILSAAIVSIITIRCFKDAILYHDINYLDYVWRIIIGFSAFPTILTIYLRSQLPETPRFSTDVEQDDAKALQNVRAAKCNEGVFVEDYTPTSKMNRISASGLGRYLTYPSILQNRNTNSDTGTLTAAALSVQNATISGTLTTNALAVQNATITGTLSAAYLTSHNATITGTLSAAYLTSQNGSIGGTLTTAVLGVNQPNPAFTLDVGGNINFTGSLYKGSLPYVSSQWTTAGSSLYIQGTNVGINTITPQNPLDVAGNISSSGIISNNVVGSLVLRVFNDSGVYAATTLTAGQPLPAPFLTRPVLDQQVGTVSLSMATFGTNVSAYSARLAGYIMPPATGTYLFRATGQDGLTLYVSTLKLTDSWLYSGSATQQVGTITMTSGVWSSFLVEHSASSTLTERLLVEWSSNAGSTYQTLTHGTTSGTFRFAYDMKEVPQSLQGTQYIAGKQFCNDLVTMSAGASLPNASYFSGKISELVNDSSLTSGGSGMATSVVGSLLMRVFDETGVYSMSSLTVGQPLPAPFLSRPLQDQTLGTVSLGAASFGTSVAAYSARIGGYIQAPQTGTYSFRVTYEDGASLYVTDQKVVDSWIYTGSLSQSIGSLTLLAGVWCPFLLEHTTSGTSTERLLVEYSINAGSYNTLANGTTSGQFRMAYNLSEFPETLLGTSYTVGKSNFSDLVTMTAGASLPNASVFTGRTSELTNDAGFGAGGSGGSVASNVVGSLLMRVFDDSVVYADTTLTVGGPLPAPFLSRPVQDVPVGTLSLSSALYGTVVSAFSARICGYINPPTTGTFLFRTTYRDGATLYVASQKLTDSWTYAGSQLQTVGTITLTQGVWSSFVLEHTTAGTATEKMLVECSANAGTLYSTLAHGTASGMFQFAYNLQEFPAAQLGTSYAFGRVYFGDTARMAAGMVLPNANYFSGNTSELNNDAKFTQQLRAANAFQGRFYSASAFTTSNSTWTCPSSGIAVATSGIPSINANVGTTMTSSAVTYNLALPGIYLPATGLWHMTGYFQVAQTAVEMRWVVMSMPAFNGSAAQNFGASAYSNTAAVLAMSGFVSGTSENGISASAILPAGTIIQPWVIATTGGSTNFYGVVTLGASMQ